MWGTLTERDSKIYEENDFEVFIGAQDAYYEFEINALNTVYEVFWIWKDSFLPGSKYFGRPEFDPATQRTMVLDGVGGHVHERGERWGLPRLGLPGSADGRACGRSGEPARQDRSWLDRGTRVSVEGAGVVARWALTASKETAMSGGSTVAGSRRSGSSGEMLDPCARVDVESPWPLRFAHPRSFSLRDVLNAIGW